jgi:hypothetical protein
MDGREPNGLALSGDRESASLPPADCIKAQSPEVGSGKKQFTHQSSGGSPGHILRWGDSKNMTGGRRLLWVTISVLSSFALFGLSFVVFAFGRCDWVAFFQSPARVARSWSHSPYLFSLCSATSAA